MFSLYVEWKADNEGEPLTNLVYKDENLGSWTSNQRTLFNKGKLSSEHIKRLEEIGIIWDPIAAQWENNFALYVEWKEDNEGEPPHSQVYKDTNLGLWVESQRQSFKNGLLSPDQIKRLEELGFVWEQLTAQWDYMFSLYVEWKENNEGESPRLLVYKDTNLGNWIARQRTEHRLGRARLSSERIKRLEEAGIVWAVRDK